jgi:hypothetical protein
MHHAIDSDDVDLALRLLRFLPWSLGVSVSVGAGSQFGVHELPIEPMLQLTGAAEHRWYPFALGQAAIAAASRGDLATFGTRVDEVLRAAARPGVEADWQAEYAVAVGRGLAAMAAGTHGDYASHLERAASMARSGRQLGSAATCLGNAAFERGLAGETAAAAALATEGLELARGVGMPSAVGINLNALALALAGADPERARGLLTESQRLRTGLGYAHATEEAQYVLVSARLADWGQVLDAAPTSIRYYHWTNVPALLAGIVNIAARAITSGSPDDAAVLQGAARRIATSATPLTAPSVSASPSHTPGGSPRGNAGLIADLRRETTGLLIAALGEERLRALRAEGEAMDTDQAVAFTLTVIESARSPA